MAKKSLKANFAFLLTTTKKKTKSKLNFPFGVKVPAANLSLEVHHVVSGEGKLFTFALKSAVIYQNIFTCNSSVINKIILLLLESNTSLEREN